MQDNKVGTITPQDYLYAYDVHGSVSMLLDDGGTSAPTVKATYGYDAYGDEDKALTTDSEESSGTTGNKDPLNSFRYTAKRFDTGSDSLDMGARRFSPDVGRFMQRDQYLGALSNLGLGSDPLTQNRYSLAGGNPLSFIESDGHRPVADGRGTAGAAVSGGGGDTTPNFQTMDRNASSGGGGARTGPSSGSGASDFGGARPQVQPVDVPRWGLGTIQGAAFISSATACGVDTPGPADAYCGSGDNRGFDPRAHPTRSKLYFELNTDTGRGYIQVNPSCDENHQGCAGALPLNAFLRRGDELMRLNEAEAKSSHARIRVTYGVLNSRFPSAYARIQGDLTFSRQGDRVSLEGDVTEYPSFEAYLYPGEGTVCTLQSCPKPILLPSRGRLQRWVVHVDSAWSLDSRRSRDRDRWHLLRLSRNPRSLVNGDWRWDVCGRSANGRPEGSDGVAGTSRAGTKAFLCWFLDVRDNGIAGGDQCLAAVIVNWSDAFHVNIGGRLFARSCSCHPDPARGEAPA